MDFARIPKHVGLIPDGNRRWADERGLPRQEGYAAGVQPGLGLLDMCRKLGIEEVSIYGFTRENVRRAGDQVEAFRAACVTFGLAVARRGAALLALGDSSSPVFPDELRPFAAERCAGDIRVNLLVNYGWQWDLDSAQRAARAPGRRAALMSRGVASSDVSRVELVVRWGGRSRLSGFLPLQCAYADLHVIDTLWPDMQPEEFVDALRWYQSQDVTMGG